MEVLRSDGDRKAGAKIGQGAAVDAQATRQRRAGDATVLQHTPPTASRCNVGSECGFTQPYDSGCALPQNTR